MSATEPAHHVINGWTVFAHPLFLAQLDALAQQVEAFKQNDPVGYVKKNASKRLAAITKLAFEAIPQDPTRPQYRQGNTVGDDHKHWFRARFLQQYRLFFRYHAPSKVIVFAWINDEDTKARLRKQRRCLSGVSQDAGKRASSGRLESIADRGAGRRSAPAAVRRGHFTVTRAPP
jgi:toxin YhaV